MADDPLKVYISLTSYGADQVRRLGQLHFAQIALDAGADGVEVRSELLIDANAELPALATLVREAGRAVVYSSADPLWRTAAVSKASSATDASDASDETAADANATRQTDKTADPDVEISVDAGLDIDALRLDGPASVLDIDALNRALERGVQLGAERVKMSIGAFHFADESSLRTIAERVAFYDMRLTIENDQTEEAGTYVALKRFFTAADSAGLDVPMTFDIGNWHYAGECPLAMAQTFAWRANYVHCKGVQRLPDKWVAVPVTASAAPWRTVLHDMPTNVPWAIEHPLMGDDLVRVTRDYVVALRAIASHQRGLRTDFLDT